MHVFSPTSYAAGFEQSSAAKSCGVPLSWDFPTDRETHQLLIAAITKLQMGYF